MKIRLSPTQIAQKVFDAVSDAIKVKITDTTFNMELDHNDGDSVYVYKKPVEHKITLQPEQGITLDYDFSHCTEIVCIDAVDISASLDNQAFKTIRLHGMVEPTPIRIFTKKIRLYNPSDKELEVTLLSR